MRDTFIILVKSSKICANTRGFIALHMVGQVRLLEGCEDVKSALN